MSRPILLLIRHAPSAATRGFRFPADEPLDADGERVAGALAGTLVADDAVTSPARRAHRTAVLAGFPDARVDGDLAELDFGRWAGRDPHEISRTQPEALRAWYADPDTAPPGGEPLHALATRLARGLHRAARPDATTVVFTHGGPIKLAVVLARGAPMSAIHDVVVPPCSVTRVAVRCDGGWEVLAGPAGGEGHLVLGAEPGSDASG